MSPHALIVRCAVLLAALACAPLAARPLVDLAVVDRDDGSLLPQYRHAGESWVAGVPGHRYAVRLANASGARVLVVLSIDGVNAVTGEDADPSQAGYVLGPWESAEIAGWRKSLDDVAGFRFTALPDSYAARTGRPDNVGVIGIAVFRERQAPMVDLPRPPYPPPYRAVGDEAKTADARDAAPAARQAAGEALAGAMSAEEEAGRQRIGTGHGEREWSPVGRTGFVRAGGPVQLAQLRYDTPARLVALGILPRAGWHGRGIARAPRAFPGGFVPDPP
ncbi:MAG TPA: hypothetical protein VM619_16220 [Luteimonas sp.]|nr:hypothetical protein [Luteimonas sp.]